MLANKNFKRNRRKHRLTVISLALSVILFLSTNCFSNYLMGAQSLYEDNNTYDIHFIAGDNELGKADLATTKSRLSTLKDVDETAYAKYVQGLVQIDTNQLDSSYLELLKQYPSDYDRWNPSRTKIIIDVEICFLDNNAYKKYLEKNNMDVSQFMDTQNLCPLIWDPVTVVLDGVLSPKNMLKEKKINTDIYCINSTSNLAFNGQIADAEKLDLCFLKFGKEGEADSDEEKVLPKEKALTKIPFEDSKVIRGKLPLGARDMRFENTLTVVLPYSAIELFPDNLLDKQSTMFQFQAKNHKQATTELQNFFKNDPAYKTSVAGHVYDSRASEESDIALMTIINIFSYGFITLITLIVIANVFNTISTNIQLRRKEFAMLKSVGMTKRDLTT